MRAFIAVEVPERLRVEVSQLFVPLHHRLAVRWVAPGNLHITLKFLGDVDETRRARLAVLLGAVASHTPAFAVRLEGVGGFPSLRSPRVLWVGVSTGSPELTTLAARVEAGCASLGFEPETRFHPHLTVGRVKEPVSGDALAGFQYVSDEFRVDCLTLIKSTLTPGGPIYDRVQVFPFTP